MDFKFNTHGSIAIIIMISFKSIISQPKVSQEWLGTPEG